MDKDTYGNTQRDLLVDAIQTLSGSPDALSAAASGQGTPEPISQWQAKVPRQEEPNKVTVLRCAD